MANRNTNAVLSIGRNIHIVAGSFAPNGSSAIDATSNLGSGWSVAYTSTGLYTITFSNKWNNLVSFTATIMLASGDDKHPQVGAYSAANRTITIRSWDASAAAVTDIAANADNRIHFLAVFSNTSVKPVRGT